MKIKLIFKLTAFLLFLAPLLHASVPTCKAPVVNIKVLLDSKPLDTDDSFVLSCKNGLLVSFSDNPSKKYFFKGRMPVSIKDGTWSINHKVCTSKAVRITPVDGRVAFGEKRYEGIVYLLNADNTLMIINKLPLEDYVTAVLYTEGWPGWPLEVYKVLAVASRTYVIHCLRKARAQGKIYHVKATNYHQTYGGAHNCQTIKDAVEQTQGIFIAYHNQPILAMFDACCGGIVPGKTRDVINFADAPYLARKYPCTFCQDCPVYSWHVELPITTVVNTLSDQFPTLRDIREVQVKTDSAGVVQNVVLYGKTNRSMPCTVNRRTFYKHFHGIKSSAYTCTKKHHKLVFDGRGYGHHIGLCQWGARQMVEEGWTYQQILKFYYPGTNLMKICSANHGEKTTQAEPAPANRQNALPPAHPENA